MMPCFSGHSFLTKSPDVWSFQFNFSGCLVGVVELNGQEHNLRVKLGLKSQPSPRLWAPSVIMCLKILHSTWLLVKLHWMAATAVAIPSFQDLSPSQTCTKEHSFLSRWDNLYSQLLLLTPCRSTRDNSTSLLTRKKQKTNNKKNPWFKLSLSFPWIVAIASKLVSCLLLNSPFPIHSPLRP